MLLILGVDHIKIKGVYNKLLDVFNFVLMFFSD